MDCCIEWPITNLLILAGIEKPIPNLMILAGVDRLVPNLMILSLISLSCCVDGDRPYL